MVYEDDLQIAPVFVRFRRISCEENTDPVIDESDLLMGYWINPVYSDTLINYERAGELKEECLRFWF